MKIKKIGIHFKGRLITSANCLELIGIEWATFKERYKSGMPIECLDTPVNRTGLRKRGRVADNIEAYKDLTPEQLETMRDFELIGNASKY